MIKANVRKGTIQPIVIVASVLLISNLIRYMPSVDESFEVSPAERYGTKSSRRPPRLSNVEVRKKLLETGLNPLLGTHESDPWKANLFAQLDHIRVSCGKLCQFNSVAELHQEAVSVPGAPFPMLFTTMDCPAIMGDEGIDAGDTAAPAIPDELQSFFTQGGAYQITSHPRLKEIYLGGSGNTAALKTGNVWEKGDIDKMVKAVGKGTLRGTYGVEETNWVRDRIGRASIKGKRVLVIGSSHPWVEAILLHFGAAEVVTLEYGAIVSHHPRIKTLVPQQFREKYFSGELGEFDGIATHSSVEHSGLGRYGDALNPWGDILAIARAWCVTKNGGFLYLGVPSGKDIVFSNWHRIYGRLRYPLVTANWRFVDQSDGKELDRNETRAGGFGGYGYLFEKLSS